jgi:hypothetical protein
MNVRDDTFFYYKESVNTRCTIFKIFNNIFFNSSNFSSSDSSIRFLVKSCFVLVNSFRRPSFASLLFFLISSTVNSASLCYFCLSFKILRGSILGVSSAIVFAHNDDVSDAYSVNSTV